MGAQALVDLIRERCQGSEQEARESCADWMPALWRALVKVPAAGHATYAGAHALASDSRRLARSVLPEAFRLAEQPHQDLEKQLFAEIARPPSGGDCLLQVLEDMVRAATGGKDTPSPYAGLPEELRYDLAVSALSALPLYLRLLRRSFVLPGIGQPLLKLLEATFQVEDPAFGQLPVLAFQTWDILTDIFQEMGNLMKPKRRDLLMQPIIYAVMPQRPLPAAEAAIASWSHLLHHLIRTPPEPTTPDPYEPASGVITSMFLAIGGDYRALNNSQGNHAGQMHPQWHLIPLVVASLRKLVVPEVVKPIATCAACLLTQPADNSGPRRAGPPAAGVFERAVESLARLWTALIQCFPADILELQGPLVPAAMSTLAEFSDKLWINTLPGSCPRLAASGQAINALVTAMTATVTSPLADWRMVPSEEGGEGGEGVEIHLGTGLAGRMFDGLLRSCPGAMLAQYPYHPEREERVTGEGGDPAKTPAPVPCIVELARVSALHILCLADPTPAAAVQRFSGLMGPLGKCPAPVEASVPIFAALADAMATTLRVAAQNKEDKTVGQAISLQLDIWAELAGHVTTWLSSTEEFSDMRTSDARDCLCSLESKALAMPATAVFSPLGLSLPDSQNQMTRWAAAWQGLHRSVADRELRIRGEAAENPILPPHVLALLNGGDEVLADAGALGFATTLVASLAEVALKSGQGASQQFDCLLLCCGQLLHLNRLAFGKDGGQANQPAEVTAVLTSLCARAGRLPSGGVLVLLLSALSAWMSPPFAVKGSISSTITNCWQAVLASFVEATAHKSPGVVDANPEVLVGRDRETIGTAITCALRCKDENMKTTTWQFLDTPWVKVLLSSPGPKLPRRPRTGHGAVAANKAHPSSDSTFLNHAASYSANGHSPGLGKTTPGSAPSRLRPHLPRPPAMSAGGNAMSAGGIAMSAGGDAISASGIAMSAGGIATSALAPAMSAGIIATSAYVPAMSALNIATSAGALATSAGTIATSACAPAVSAGGIATSAGAATPAGKGGKSRFSPASAHGAAAHETTPLGTTPVLRKQMAAALGEASQTEYVRIPSSSKKRKEEVLTARQEAVRAHQRAGAAREGIVTYTGLDAASQDVSAFAPATSALPLPAQPPPAAALGPTPPPAQTPPAGAQTTTPLPDRPQPGGHASAVSGGGSGNAHGPRLPTRQSPRGKQGANTPNAVNGRLPARESPKGKQGAVMTNTANGRLLAQAACAANTHEGPVSGHIVDSADNGNARAGKQVGATTSVSCGRTAEEDADNGKGGGKRGGPQVADVANTGNTDTAANTGNAHTAANTGDAHTAANTGDAHAPAKTGNAGAAANTGNAGTAAVPQEGPGVTEEIDLGEDTEPEDAHAVGEADEVAGASAGSNAGRSAGDTGDNASPHTPGAPRLDTGKTASGSMNAHGPRLPPRTPQSKSAPGGQVSAVRSPQSTGPPPRGHISAVSGGGTPNSHGPRLPPRQSPRTLSGRGAEDLLTRAYTLVRRDVTARSPRGNELPNAGVQASSIATRMTPSARDGAGGTTTEADSLPGRGTGGGPAVSGGAGERGGLPSVTLGGGLPLRRSLEQASITTRVPDSVDESMDNAGSPRAVSSASLHRESSRDPRTAALCRAASRDPRTASLHRGSSRDPRTASLHREASRERLPEGAPGLNEQQRSLSAAGVADPFEDVVMVDDDSPERESVPPSPPPALSPTQGDVADADMTAPADALAPPDGGPGCDGADGVLQEGIAPMLGPQNVSTGKGGKKRKVPAEENPAGFDPLTACSQSDSSPLPKKPRQEVEPGRTGHPSKLAIPVDGFANPTADTRGGDAQGFGAHAPASGQLAGPLSHQEAGEQPVVPVDKAAEARLCNGYGPGVDASQDGALGTGPAHRHMGVDGGAAAGLCDPHMGGEEGLEMPAVDVQAGVPEAGDRGNKAASLADVADSEGPMRGRAMDGPTDSEVRELEVTQLTAPPRAPLVACDNLLPVGRQQSGRDETLGSPTSRQPDGEPTAAKPYSVPMARAPSTHLPITRAESNKKRPRGPVTAPPHVQALSKPADGAVTAPAHLQTLTGALNGPHGPQQLQALSGLANSLHGALTATPQSQALTQPPNGTLAAPPHSQALTGVFNWPHAALIALAHLQAQCAPTKAVPTSTGAQALPGFPQTLDAATLQQLGALSNPGQSPGSGGEVSRPVNPLSAFPDISRLGLPGQTPTARAETLPAKKGRGSKKGSRSVAGQAAVHNPGTTQGARCILSAAGIGLPNATGLGLPNAAGLGLPDLAPPVPGLVEEGAQPTGASRDGGLWGTTVENVALLIMKGFHVPFSEGAPSWKDVADSELGRIQVLMQGLQGALSQHMTRLAQEVEQRLCKRP